MRWVYVSPHLDDAILSAGGLIYEQVQAGTPVEIWTILSGQPPAGELSPFAQVIHYEWGIATPEEAIPARRQEDLKAARHLGAGIVHFDFLDCIYRQSRVGEWLYSSVYDPPHTEDVDLLARIADTLAPRLTPDVRLICHLGIGSHVDHVLVRWAVELLGRSLHYIADVPYLFKYPHELDLGSAGMEAKVHRVSEAGLQSWLEAIECYPSQLSSLFESLEAMRAQVSAYWAETRGVRVWRIK